MEFDELVEHLDDLAELAASEKFPALEGLLIFTAAFARARRDLYALQDEQQIADVVSRIRLPGGRPPV